MFRTAAAIALLAAAPALAHHGWSSYDADRVIKLTAPLSEVTFGAPHGTAKVAYQGKTWDVVLAPVSRMEARGLTQGMIKPGVTKVTLEGYPRADGAAEMRIERITVGEKTVELR